MEDLLDRLFAQQWVLAVVVLALLLLTGALGDRLGCRLFSTVDEAHRSQIGAMQAVVLAMPFGRNVSRARHLPLAAGNVNTAALSV